MLKKIFLLIIVSFSAFTAFSQDEFDTETTSELIIDRINEIRKENNKDKLKVEKILSNASLIQAEDMAITGKAKLENSSGKLATTGDRVVASGGTRQAKELVTSVKSPKTLTPEEVVDIVIEKWEAKGMPTMLDGIHKFVGVNMRLNESGKKGYVSAVFGNYKTLNEGGGGDKAKRKELEAPYSNSAKKLTAPGKKTCKNAAKFSDYETLLEGVYVEGGVIYVKYNNVKLLSKLLKGSKDGLAVDVIQREQYTNPNYNIINYNLQSKGVVTKTKNYAKMMSKNRAEPDAKGKMRKIDTPLSKFPKKVTGAYELNLLVVLNGSVCKTLYSTYIEKGTQESSGTSLTMLMMPEGTSEGGQDSTGAAVEEFVPVSEKVTLTFDMPFEKQAYDYSDEDLDPFLKAVTEPDVIIHDLNVIVYSSIEGFNYINSGLRRKRLKGITNAIKKVDKMDIVTDIHGDDSWEVFSASVAGAGDFAYLAAMEKEEAILEINTKEGLSEALEPILETQRLTRVIMNISYDISGGKEEPYVIAKFNEAVNSGDIAGAVKIHKFLTKKIKSGDYSKYALTQLELPKKKEFAGIHNNQLVFNYFQNDSVPTVEDYELLKKISGSTPENKTIAFNKLYCALELDDEFVSDPKNRSEIQSEIDGLYEGNVPKNLVDALNLEFQFKILDAAANADESKEAQEDARETTEKTITKIKSFFDLSSSSSIENNLKLSFAFAEYGDFIYASELLAGFMNDKIINEAAVYAYISYAAHSPEMINSDSFVTALHKAENVNHDRYCKLFGDPFLTFQVLENPGVKEYYMNIGCE